MSGEKKIEELPALKVSVDWDGQRVLLDFDSTQFKAWDFVVAALEMALGEAKFRLGITRAANMQQAQANAMREQQMLNSLRPGIQRGR